MSELSIKVTIAGRIYPISVRPEEEEGVRLAAKRVEDNLKELLSSYAVKDKQDLLAMTALQLATSLAALEAQPPSSIGEEELKHLETLVDALL